MFRRVLYWGVFAWLLLCLASGCGKSKPIKLSGILTWEDGKPVEGATVLFMPQKEGGRPASGFTGKDGSFDLTTQNSGDGALPGDYKVVVTQTEPVLDAGAVGPGPDPGKAMKEWFEKKSKGGGKPSKSEIPTVYSTEKTTPLKWTVEPGGGKAEFKLKKI